MIINQHPLQRDISICFNEEDHSYIDNRGLSYTPVSGLISKFFEEFDTEVIAERCSRKRGIPKETLIRQWKEAGDSAAEKGHIVHDMLRCKFLNLPFNTVRNDYLNEVNNIHRSLINKVDVVYIEVILFDPDLLIAGTCDAVFIDKLKTKYIVADWKTSKIITTNNYGKFGFNPIQDLPDCNYIHYSLQLQLYSYLLKSNHYLDLDIPFNHRLVHVKESNSKSMDIMNYDITKLIF